MVMKKSSSYEDLRLQRIQENMKRMKDLKLDHLAINLKKSSSIQKPRVMVQKKLELVPAVQRRSSRLSDKPAPTYREVDDDFQIERRKCRSAGICRRRDRLGDYPVASETERAYATRKSEKLESDLIRDDGFPCFAKSMLHSHVCRGFWLVISRLSFLRFGVLKCRLFLLHFATNTYLPERNEIITLVDESGEEFETYYLAKKMGLSAGWRRFAIVHGLIDGDASVFQLVEPMKFKVRSSNFKIFTMLFYMVSSPLNIKAQAFTRT
ncbi:hypothetical protein MKW98_000901 [Papaver atlanticum]|uniref:TF-B3 domain-containing protein n=1 Tax=Papaver atlanticum TaxID=357466 RepID=A0AAD4SFH9_9MAGN|nr:hypothetical protein MKW98_000901 [Papaver atlanticum]